MIVGHGGNLAQAAVQAGIDPADITDMSSNTNPLGPMPGMLDHLQTVMDSLTHLPEADSRMAIQSFADLSGWAPDTMLAAGGTTQFIYSLPRLSSGGRALIVGPTYADYADACAMNGLPFSWCFPEKKGAFDHDLNRIARLASDCRLVFLCNPNNPTGNLYDPDSLQWLAAQCPHAVFVFDESYLPFVANAPRLSLADNVPANGVVLRSFSKIYKVPGLRIGFALASPALKAALAKFQLPWSVGSLAQQAIRFAADNRLVAAAHIAETVTFVDRERKRILAALDSAAGLQGYAGVTPFVLFQLPAPLTSAHIWQAMLAQGILVRDCANCRGLGPRFIRISLKDAHANTRAVDLLNRLARAAGKSTQ